MFNNRLNSKVENIKKEIKDELNIVINELKNDIKNIYFDTRYIAFPALTNYGLFVITYDKLNKIFSYQLKIKKYKIKETINVR